MADEHDSPPARAAVGPGPGRLAWIVLPLATFLTASSAVWLQQNLLLFPPPWDQATYLTMSLRFWHGLQDGGLRGLLTALADGSAVWPPLFPLSTSLLYALLGESRLVAHLTNGLYLVLLLAGIQSLATSAYGRRAGVVAVLLACGFSDVIRLSRDYLLDFPASAMLAVAMAAFVRSRDLRHRGGAVAFGVAAGMTALTKTMTGIFMIAPVARSVFGSLRSERRVVSRNLALAAAAALLVAGPWWVPHFATALTYLVHFGVGSGAAPYASGGRTVLGVRNVTYYGWVLANNAVAFPAWVIFAALIAYRAWQRLRGEGTLAASRLDGMFWTWIGAGYVVLTLVPNKGGDRYALFLLPPLAALYAGGLDAIAHRTWRIALTALALAAAAFNYVVQTWGIAALPHLVVVHPVVFLQQDYPQFLWLRTSVPLSAETPWPVDHLPADVADIVVGGRRARARDVMRAEGAGLPPEGVLRLGYRSLLGRDPDAASGGHLAALRSGALDGEGLLDALARSDEFAGRPVRVLVVPDHPVVNAATLDYYAESARVRVRHAHLPEWPAPRESLTTFDAAVLKEDGWQGPEFTTRSSAAMRAALLDPASGYRRAASWPCPDGSRVVLLVRG